MAFQYSPKIITDGLVLALDAANQKSYPGSGVVWNDLISSIAGNFNSGPTFSSNNSGYLSFDGTDDWVTLDIATTSVDIKTISFWYKRTFTTNAGVGYLISNQGTGETQKGIAREENNNTANRFYYYNGSQIVYITTNTVGINVTINQSLDWQNLTFIENKLTNTLSVYRNGQFVQDITVTNMGINIKTIGKGFTGGGLHPMTGNIAQLLVYNRALSSTEILQNYNTTKSRFGL
jgi:hypothetical protein